MSDDKQQMYWLGRVVNMLGLFDADFLEKLHDELCEREEREQDAAMERTIAVIAKAEGKSTLKLVQEQPA